MGADAMVGQNPATALRDPDPFVRTEALTRSDSAVDAAESLLDAYPLVRREAVRTLSRLGDEVSTKALVHAAAHDPSAEVREEAVSALGLLVRELRLSTDRP